MPAFFIGEILELYRKYIDSLYKGKRSTFYSTTAFMTYELDEQNDLLVYDMYSESFKGFKKLLTKLKEIDAEMVYCRISLLNPKHDYIVKMYKKFGFTIYFENEHYTNLYIQNEEFKRSCRRWVI